MDEELKTLKVADLKAVLAKAHVQVPSKTNKPDLVAKILSSQPALDAYKSMYKPDADLLAPPEEYAVSLSHCAYYNPLPVMSGPRYPLLTRQQFPPPPSFPSPTSKARLTRTTRKTRPKGKTPP